MIDDFDDAEHGLPAQARRLSPVQLTAPQKSFYAPQGQIEGYMVLTFFGQPVTFIGGAFDSFRPGALGICLEKHSGKAGLATHPFPIEDFQAPSTKHTEGLLIQVLNEALAEPGTPIYVGCRAGRGRTGTILAAFAKVSDEAPDDAVAYVRAKYLKSAVETQAQAKLVRDLNVHRVRAIIKYRPVDAEEQVGVVESPPIAKPAPVVLQPTLLERWFRLFNW